MMKKAAVGYMSLMILGIVTFWPVALSGQRGFELVTGKAFDSALPKDFYLEGNAIPTEKRNAVLLKSPTGARALIALLDTSGYSSQVQEKYLGMVISEGALSICGIELSVGSYGFGLVRPSPVSNADGKFLVYNQAGEKVGECVSEKGTDIGQPKPLQVVPGEDGQARVYLGRYWVGLK